MADTRPERVKALRDKSLPKCKRPDCKLHVSGEEFNAQQGYCTLICLINDYAKRGVQFDE